MHFFKYLPCALALGAVAALQVFTAWAEDDVLEIQHQGTLSYVSGGIGSEESVALEIVQRNYNLRIMSSDKTGHYSSDIHIVVSDFDHNAILDTTGGPLFYTNLPNGSYVVEGFNKGQSKKQVVTIVGGRPAHVHFIWRENSADAINH